MIRIGIVGYGNLAKGVEAAVTADPKMELVAVFTRRDPETLSTATPTAVYAFDRILEFKDQIDILINCGGSATDLPKTTPELAEHFNVIDSFDTHAGIPAHFAATDQSAKRGGKLSIISVGWDPGLFSFNRLCMNAFLPEGKDYTFWGKGVSQGHSDAIRRINGVIDARQYTVPIQSAMDQVRSGEQPELTTRQKHLRECYVVAEENADLKAIESEIKNMPNYFADYDTTVEFITLEELQKNHAGIPHGGHVIRTGVTGLDHDTKQIIEFSLSLESNPEFTGSVLTAYARAAYQLAAKGETGCRTVFDIPPALLINMSPEEQRARLL